MKVTLTCYGDAYAEHDIDLAEAKRLAEEHIRACPQGPMTWATEVRWYEVDYRPERDSHKWVSASKGEWVSHHIEEQL